MSDSNGSQELRSSYLHLAPKRGNMEMDITEALGHMTAC